MHIYQKNSKVGDDIYVVVNTEGFEGDLSQHPSVVENPELFEVSEGDTPEGRIIYILNYSS